MGMFKYIEIICIYVQKKQYMKVFKEYRDAEEMGYWSIEEERGDWYFSLAIEMIHDEH